MTERKIVTYHQFPPIPIRTLDWIAYREGDEEGGYGDDGLSPSPGSLFGYGRTEEAAIRNLIEEEGYAAEEAETTLHDKIRSHVRGILTRLEIADRPA